MSIIIPKATAQRTDYQPLLDLVDSARYGDGIDISSDDLDIDMLDAIYEAADAVGDKKTYRIAEALLAARKGNFDKSIPNLVSGAEIILAYLRHNLQDGWIYSYRRDGHPEPWLVVDVKYVMPDRNGSDPHISMSMVANQRPAEKENRRPQKGGLAHYSVTLHASDITRKKVSEVLEAHGLYVETPSLREDYEEALERHTEILTTGFAKQYRMSGTPREIIDGSFWHDPKAVSNRKVVHDIKRNEISSFSAHAPSTLFSSAGEDTAPDKARRKGDDGDGVGVGEVPVHFDVRVFDLVKHQYMWVNSRDLVLHEWDKTLRDKIVLPDDQQNLLDILTQDLKDFTSDIIEGKSAGNVVLCKGAPGVGKTLTAEVYSELIERPLYSIHSGNLGINAEDIRKRLEVVFERVLRWDAVLLLDEADVFVLERGANIEQNAIVAEFLRTLEYFDGLMFMTTNRSDSIDDAILSRAAAIIDYQVPDIDGIREVWLVQGRNNGVEIGDALLDALVHGFKDPSPRDIKMLLRLALRVSKANDEPLTPAVFARCAMFRGMHFEEGSR